MKIRMSDCNRVRMKITIIFPVHSCCWREKNYFYIGKKNVVSNIGREAAAESFSSVGRVLREVKALTHVARERWKIREKFFTTFHKHMRIGKVCFVKGKLFMLHVSKWLCWIFFCWINTSDDCFKRQKKQTNSNITNIIIPQRQRRPNQLLLNNFSSGKAEWKFKLEEEVVISIWKVFDDICESVREPSEDTNREYQQLINETNTIVLRKDILTITLLTPRITKWKW